VKAALSIQGQLGVVFYPYISKMLSISKEKAITSIKKAFVVTMLFAILATTVIFFNASEIVKFVFGSNFSLTVIPLQILSFLFIPLALSNIFGMQIFLPFGKRKELMKAALLTACLDIILLMALCPILNEVGAALSYFLSESFVSFWMFYRVKDMRITFLDKSVLIKFLFFIFALISINIITSVYFNMSILKLVISILAYMILIISFKFVNLKEKSIFIG
jgi:O-antigen/teichoic acid export membrane protein